MRFKFLVFTILFSISAQAQLWPGAHLQEDLDFLIASIHQYEPALDTYAPYFDQNAKKLMSELPDECTPYEYLTFVSRLCAFANEGHFAIGSWSDTVHRGIPQNTYTYLPLEVRVIEGRIFVWEDVSEEQPFQRGDELLSINGGSARQIIEQLYATTPGDGDIFSYLERTIELGFPWLYYFHVEQPKSFEVAYRAAGAAGQVATLEALTRDKQVENYRARNKEKSSEVDPPFAFDIDGKRALWSLTTFSRGAVEEAGIKAKKYYKERFKEIQERGVETLVIDLRGNMGGLNEFADEMLPYLLQNQPGESWLKKTVSWEGKTKRYKQPKPSKYNYSGSIYVLVNGRTFSNGSTLTRYLKEFGNAVVIGEETGSRYEGYAAGSKQYVTLPHSKMSIGIPRYKIEYPESSKQKTRDRGVIPTYVVRPSIEDLVEGRDTAVEFLMRLLDE